MAGCRACEHGTARKRWHRVVQVPRVGHGAQGGMARRAVGSHRAGPDRARARAGPGGPFGHLYPVPSDVTRVPDHHSFFSSLSFVSLAELLLDGLPLTSTARRAVRRGARRQWGRCSLEVAGRSFPLACPSRVGSRMARRVSRERGTRQRATTMGGAPQR
jgi:hypothetical protein